MEKVATQPNPRVRLLGGGFTPRSLELLKRTFCIYGNKSAGQSLKAVTTTMTTHTNGRTATIQAPLTIVNAREIGKRGRIYVPFSAVLDQERGLEQPFQDAADEAARNIFGANMNPKSRYGVLLGKFEHDEKGAKFTLWDPSGAEEVVHVLFYTDDSKVRAIAEQRKLDLVMIPLKNGERFSAKSGIWAVVLPA